MASILASAPAKLILCGEHAVVYGQPAIALPLANIRARAEILAGQAGRGVVVVARELRRSWPVAAEPKHPLSELVGLVLAQLSPSAPAPDLRIIITSAIPIASGMGSGAAVASAVVRGLAGYFGQQLAPAAISALVYASEQRFHGTPSGIDNTVIAYEQPIWFVRQKDAGQQTKDDQWRSSAISPAVLRPPSPLIEPIAIASRFTLLIGDTGMRSPTHAPVSAVRQRWQAAPAHYEQLFAEVGALVAQARKLLAVGDLALLGALLDQNHRLLQQIGVSSPELDALAAAARRSGALGAKLSGAGWGGIMLALVAPDRADAVAAALKTAGARRVIGTTVLEHQL